MENLVSIIIPFFNRTESLKRAINSVLNQTYKNIEIILINDGSNESITDIESIAKKNKNLYLYSNSKNHGPSYSRNKGLKNAKGEFIAFLDSDDEWLSFKLEYQIKYMLRKNLNFTYTSYLRNCSDSDSVKLIKIKRNQRFPHLAFKCEIATPTVVVRKTIFENINFERNLKYGEDIIFWANLSKKIKIKGINIPTTIVNVSKISSSNNLLIQEEGFYNINKYLFKGNIFLKLIHKIYYKTNLIFKKIYRIIKN